MVQVMCDTSTHGNEIIKKQKEEGVLSRRRKEQSLCAWCLKTYLFIFSLLLRCSGWSLLPTGYRYILYTTRDITYNLCCACAAVLCGFRLGCALFSRFCQLHGFCVDLIK